MMNRFFFDKTTLVADSAIIEGEDVAHISRVLRFEIGDKLIICDGEGYDYLAEVSLIEKSFVKVKVLDKNKAISEPEVDVTLFQGIPKGEKMELIIQKSVELGISRIVPVSMTRCVVKLGNEKDERKKQERWQKIAREAAKQSGRGIIPEITMPVNYKTAMKMSESLKLRVLPYEKESNEENGIRTVLCRVKETEFDEKIKNAAILIGPEGGFDLKEVSLALEAGFKTVTLGKRILRTETAGFVALSCLMYEFGEME